jgi:hypothetical protein
MVSGIYRCCTISGYYSSFQEYQNCSVAGDATVDLASEPAEPAPASKHSRDMKKDKQPGEYASSKMKRTASHIDASKTFLALIGILLTALY